ncbi:MAG: polysaccharide biosynthesis/export family protein [Isosphaerales bacterium]
MRHSPCRPTILAAGLLIFSVAGCHGLARKHEAKSIPQYGAIDPSQPGELRKVSQPPYVIEPPDELEITAQPSYPAWSLANFTVQADGFVDLGLAGEVYVYGLTLPEAEQRITVQLNDHARGDDARANPRYRVSVRLATGQSKYFYVLGTVANQGRYKANANDTVLDAILQAGLKSNSLPEKAYLVRPHPLGGADQILKIDWVGIKDRGDTLTNYQLFPGDRVVVPGTRPPGLISTLLGN